MSRADVISWLSGEERHSLRALIPKVPMIFKAQLSLDRFISLFRQHTFSSIILHNQKELVDLFVILKYDR